MVDALIEALEKEPWRPAAQVSPSSVVEARQDAIGFDHDDPTFTASVRPVEG
jgi:hypothetical protein